MTFSPSETRSPASKPPREIFTIQRKSRPVSDRRYLYVDDEGDLCWAIPSLDFNLYATARSAELFRTFRLGRHAADAEVVRHAVH